MDKARPAGGEATPARLRQPIRHPKLKSALLLTLIALPLAGVTEQALNGQGAWVALAYAVTSLLSLGLYGWDKRQAVHGQRRVPEKVLHGIELLGGWPGAWVAQQVFRHKTRKLRYQVVFWLIVAAHQLYWFYVLGLAHGLLTR